MKATTVRRILHRYVWRRLPRRARRSALTTWTTLVAPRISAEAAPAAPIVVAGMLSQASGLGAAARACHDALKAAGLPVYGVDLSYLVPDGGPATPFLFTDGRNLRGRGTLLLHMVGPLVPLAMLALGRPFVQDKHVVAHWFWELPKVPDQWRRALRFIHEIWVNTEFVGEAMKSIAGPRPVKVVPYPMREPNLGPERNDREFTVLIVFNVASNFARKNPCAAIHAFRAAFGADPTARLIVKYMNAHHWPESERLLQAAGAGAGNIEWNANSVDPAEMERLFQRADVVLSLHRSEGLGLVVAEAMRRGLAVIATDWSGNRDFLTAYTGVPIGYRMTPVVDEQANYSGLDAEWAEPDVEAAARALAMLRDDPGLRRRLGDQARAAADDTFAPARFAEHVEGWLRQEPI